MILDATTRKIQALMSGAAATTNPTVTAGWVDLTTTATTQGGTPSNLNGVTAVDIVDAPAGSTQRKVNSIYIYNIDTAAVTVTVRYNDNATLYKIVVITLAVGDTLCYTDVGGWFVIDSSGGTKAAPSSGRYVRTVVLTSGTSHTTGTGTNSIFVRLQAGGGAGGGCTSVAASAGAAGGGSAGGYAEKTFTVSPNTAYTYAIGAGGTGASAAAGNPGGITTFAVGATTVTANGGLGGPQCVPITTIKAYLGAASPAVSTNGDMNAGGAPGGPGIILIVSGSVGVSGEGGSSQLGPGALGVIAAGNGTTATVGFGGGGSGGLTAASAARTGGDGRVGCIVVDEFS